MAPRRFVFSLAALASMTALSAQVPRPSFEVASVKKIDASGPPLPSRRYPLDSAIYAPPYATVYGLIQFAYNVGASQVVGGPEWIRSDNFEVIGQSAAKSTADEKRQMVQSLLEERFKLVVHKEQRKTEFGSLMLARDDGRVGPGLTQCDEPSAGAEPMVYPRVGRLVVLRCVPVTAIADVAARRFNLPVVDRTGLTGLWNLVLKYSDTGQLPDGLELDPTLSAFPTALREQLGLRVQNSVGLLEMLVIDSVQQPTPN